MSKTCSTCGDAAKGGICERCIAFETDFDDHDCGNCGGEGFIYGCGWDWQCDTWDGNNCLCTRRCEWCQPLKPDEMAERAKLQQVLADALAQPKEGGHG